MLDVCFDWPGAANNGSNRNANGNANGNATDEDEDEGTSCDGMFHD